MLRLVWRKESLLLSVATATLLVVLSAFVDAADAFTPAKMFHLRREQRYTRIPTLLLMGKGFNSAQSKQAELAKKMQLAKKKRDPEQKEEEQSMTAPETVADSEEIKLEQDRAMFAKLLAKNQPPPERKERATFTRPGSNASFERSNKSIAPSPAGTKVRAKDLKRRRKKESVSTKGIDEAESQTPVRYQESDIAKRTDFEKLVSLETSKPLGPMAAAQLVPWVPPYLNEYLVVLADPRKQSGDLRQSILYLTSNLTPEILSQVVVVSADSPGETTNWVSRANVETPIRIFSDEKLDWMRTYSAVVDDERWSMSIFVFCTQGIIQKLIRQVDATDASQLVTKILQSLDEDD